MTSWAASESAICEDDAPRGTFTRMGSPSPSARRSHAVVVSASARPSAAGIERIRLFIGGSGTREGIEVSLQDEHRGACIDAILLLALATRDAARAHRALGARGGHALVDVVNGQPG